MEWLLQIPILLFSVIFHEYAHGYMAYKRGDDTAYLMGRLTFNPIPHIDPFGTILMPAICVLSGMPMFGWARPVPVNPLRLDSPRADMSWVAFSGPLSNLFLAVLSALLYKAAALAVPLIGPGLASTLMMGLRFAVIINLALAFLNLIPVYPLDGGQILLNRLPDGPLLRTYEKHVPYGIYIIFGLILTGVLKYLILPPIYYALTLLAAVGLPVI
ncbi:MAG: Zn-dependent protease [Elusimicrobia bacterium]|nr:MAG: Zn-dependent protease [Elusimicrobiota bacterium]KAF0157857.1 MAG: Zn-dependent protease [Elusimicrobiota bacterium]